jgi:hypothetical protein
MLKHLSLFTLFCIILGCNLYSNQYKLFDSSYCSTLKSKITLADINGQFAVKDSIVYLYSMNYHSQGLIKFNINSQISEHYEISNIKGVACDNFQRTWWHSGDDGFFFLRNDSIISVNEQIEKESGAIVGTNTNFVTDSKSNLWFSNFKTVYKVDKDSLIKFNLENMGIYSMAFDPNCIAISNDLIGVNNNSWDTLFIINSLNTAQKQKVAIHNFDIPKTSLINKIYGYKSGFYLLIKTNALDASLEQEYQLWKYSNNSLVKINLDYELDKYYLKHISIDPNSGYITALLDYPKKIDTNDSALYSKVYIFSNELKIEKSIDLPFIASGYNTPIIQDSYFKDSVLWLGFSPLGLIKIDLKSSSVENAEYSGNDELFIHTVYPNPTSNQSSVYFFCIPDKINDLKVALYNSMGEEVKQVDYNLTEFDYNTGLGRFSFNTQGISKGFYILALKLGNNTIGTQLIKI